MNFLYYRTSVKIFWRSILTKASLRGTRFILFALPGILAILILSSVLQAQELETSWQLEGEGFQISNNTGDDFSPSVAFMHGFLSSTNLYLVVWARKTSSGFDIYGARFTLRGQLLDEGGFPICTAPDDQMLPMVISGGDNFFVVWQDRRSGKRWEIYGARVTSEGQVLDPDGILVGKGRSSNDQTSPALSFDGENYAVVWQGKQKNTWNINVCRVTKSGEVIEAAPIRVNPSRYDQVFPAISFDGEGYFVVWQDFRSNKFWDVYGARIASSGEVLDLEGIAITDDGQSSWDRWYPVISWNGSYYFIVWMVSLDGVNWNLYGKRVGRDGSAIDLVDFPVETEGSNKASPSLLWNTSEYLMVWEEELDNDSKIFMAPVLPEGPAQPGERVLVSSMEATNASMPSFARGGDMILIVWQGKSQEGYWNIYGQLLSRPEPSF